MMKILLIAIPVLIMLFSLGVSGYVSFYKIPLQNRINQVVTFLVLSMATTAATFVICLSIIWPPIKM